jgi:hypothetical protein
MYQYFIQGWIRVPAVWANLLAPTPYPAIIVYVLRLLIKIPEGNTIKYIFLTPLTFCERELLNLKQLCKRYSHSPMQFFSAHCVDDNRLETKLCAGYIFFWNFSSQDQYIPLHWMQRRAEKRRLAVCAEKSKTLLD